MDTISVISFIGFTLLVAVGTWLIVRKREVSSKDGFFLAGRNLTFPFIAGSLLLTNLSTEQMVGLNGSAFKEGLSVMAWEVVAVVALVLMGLFFLPKFLKKGITTVPEFLAERFDRRVEFVCNIIFLLAYMMILMPIILYTGARGMIDIFDLGKIMNVGSEITELYIIVVAVAVIGSLYVLTGGLYSCAVSDTLYGIGLLIGGFMIPVFALNLLGGDVITGTQVLIRESGSRMNSIGANNAEAPFLGLFSGVLLINVFYWCTNQQIIQRTLGAKSLSEGQKGVFLTGLLKLLGPVFLVLPGMIAAILFMRGQLNIPLNPKTGLAVSDKAYGALVNLVLPAPLKGFFAAVLLGAILSSFNSALNSCSTLFSLGFYRHFRENASDRELVRSGRIFGFVIAIGGIIIAPLLSKTGSIFNYLQSMNSIYFIPILAVVVMAMLSKKVPAFAATSSLIGGVILLALGYFVPFFKTHVVNAMGQYLFVAAVFLLLIVWMLLAAKLCPMNYMPTEVKLIDFTPWKYAKLTGCALLLIVILIYAAFADFSVFRTGKPPYPVRIDKTLVPGE